MAKAVENRPTPAYKSSASSPDWPAGHNVDEFVDEKTVGLEERSRGHAVGGALSLISQFLNADRDQRFLHAFLRFAERRDAYDLRHGRAQFFGPRPHRCAPSLGSAEEFEEQFCVVGVGEELDLVHTFHGFARTSRLPECSDTSVDQRAS